MRWLRRSLALWAAYTVGHWVGWGKAAKRTPFHQGGMDDTWSDYYRDPR